MALAVDAPRFHTIADLLGDFRGTFPDLAALNSLADEQGLRNARGLPLRFVSPTNGDYEALIFSEGSVPTREANWHDLFNALAWFAFPLTKALLNRLHVEEIAKQDDSRRSRMRDVLTLFDESGMIVASADTQLTTLLRNFKWHDLFWLRRDEVKRKMAFHVFGHALHEQLRDPYKGITGKALIVDVDAQFLSRPSHEQRRDLDEWACAQFQSGTLQTTRDLQPVPVLGIPDWCADNGAESYYDDTAYFRAGRGGHQNKAPL